MSKAKQENEGLRQKKDGVQADHSRALIAVQTMHTPCQRRSHCFSTLLSIFSPSFLSTKGMWSFLPILHEEKNVKRVELSKFRLYEHERRCRCNGALTSRDASDAFLRDGSASLVCRCAMAALHAVRVVHLMRPRPGTKDVQE